jgi:hypothetical protein
MSVDGAAPIRAKIKEIVPEYFFPVNSSSQSVNTAIADTHLQKAAGHD